MSIKTNVGETAFATLTDSDMVVVRDVSDGRMGYSTLATIRTPDTYTLAAVPSAVTAGTGALISVSNGNAGAKCLAMSDGTNWKVIALGATIS